MGGSVREQDVKDFFEGFKVDKVRPPPFVSASPADGPPLCGRVGPERPFGVVCDL